MRKVVAPSVNWRSGPISWKVGVEVLVSVAILFKVIPGMARASDVQAVGKALVEAQALTVQGKTQEAIAKLKSVESRYKTPAQQSEVNAKLKMLTQSQPTGTSIEAFDQMLRDRGQPGVLYLPATPGPRPTLPPKRTTVSTTLPTTDPNPKVYCYYDNRCGGTKITTRDECVNTACCFNGTTYAIDSKTNCQAYIDERAKKQAESWNAQQTQMNAEIDAIQKTVNNLSQKNEQAQAELLQLCRDQAEQTYKQDFYGGKTTTTGYVVGESPELRQKLNQALAKCLELYGGQ